MKRFARLAAVMIGTLLIWLLPFDQVSYSGLERTIRKLGERSLIGWIRHAITGRRREKVWIRVNQLLEESWLPEMTKIVRKGFARLGSSSPQNVQHHTLQYESIYRDEGEKEGLTRYDIEEGAMGIRVHDVVELRTGDKERLTLPHRKVARVDFVKRWIPTKEWVLGPKPAHVSPQWLQRYKEERPYLVDFLSDQGVEKAVVREILRLYDEFHTSPKPHWVLARDCYHKELIQEGIDEEVPVDHFYREAVVAVVSDRIRAEIQEKYVEALGKEKGLEQT